MINFISTKTGDYNKRKFNALIDIRSTSLSSIRNYLEHEGFSEVLTAVLVNIAGSCENPYASFKLPYYGKEAHLSQSAQIQLERLVVTLNRKCFTVNNSFREENYEDPDSKERRLSEFTLIEPEMPFQNTDSGTNLQVLINTVEKIIKSVIALNLQINYSKLQELGSDIELLEKCQESSFKVITYKEAMSLLKGNNYRAIDNISAREEKELLKYNNNMPFFLTGFPFQQKFFNIKRVQNTDLTYSFDLIAPCLGETVGGGIREENSEIILKQLKESTVGKFLTGQNENPEDVFNEYFNALNQSEPVKRGGFGIGFERMIGFLINSNDILNTITHRSFVPEKENLRLYKELA